MNDSQSSSLAPLPGLSIATYESRELDVSEDLPNRVIEMVNPVVFASEGYPMRVRREQSLWRYVDVMHERRFEENFESLHQGGLTAPEFDWLKDAARATYEFSQQVFGRPLTSRGALLRALQIFRSIVDIVGPKPLRVFEAGPGSGSLGCLFLQNGWGYAATDITQAFYLLQSRLWNHVSRGGLVELADPATKWDGGVAPGCPVHVPWWEFFQMAGGRVPEVDIVTSNHALAEMHPNSLAFTLRIAREMLRGEGLRLFVFEGWGWDKLQSTDKVLQAFLQVGFTLVHTDGLVTVFAPNENVAAADSVILPGGQIRQHVQSGSSIHLPGNVLTPRILRAREQRKRQLVAKRGTVDAFYRELLGTDNLNTPDEEFLSYIGRHY